MFSVLAGIFWTSLLCGALLFAAAAQVRHLNTWLFLDCSLIVA
jgi:hypothetical protein